MQYSFALCTPITTCHYQATTVRCHFTYLGHGVELDHGFSEGIGIGSQVGDQSQHGPVEGAIDLLQGGGARVVHIDDGHVTEEPNVQQRDWTGSCYKVDLQRIHQ